MSVMTEPTLIGSVMHTNIANVTAVPQRRLGDLILPVNDRGLPEPKGSFIRPGAWSKRASCKKPDRCNGEN